MRTAPPLRLVFAVAGMALAGCSELGLVQRPISAPAPAPPVDRTFDLPDIYDILDVRYASDLVAADSNGVRGRSTVQVFVEHRETGEVALLVYDLALAGAEPASVIRFRRSAATIAEADDVSDDEAPEAETTPAPPRRQW